MTFLLSAAMEVPICGLKLEVMKSSVSMITTNEIAAISHITSGFLCDSSLNYGTNGIKSPVTESMLAWRPVKLAVVIARVL
jgi:hypothetical protein